MKPITFTVFGKAQPKGSARAIPFRDRRSGRLRVNVMSANPALKSWERLVKFEAQTAVRHAGLDTPVFDGPVAIRLKFGLARPKRIPKARGPLPVVKPDLDKLMRGALDALSGVLYRDDAQICKFIEPEKFYVIKGDRPFVEITVSEHSAGVQIREV